ncbi:MAG: phenylalanine--tRNA ligase subunit beta [Acidimicrobiia bacterium]
MKVLLSWLNDYAPFGDDVDALEAALNRIGLAVDAVERAGASIPGVVTAVVLRTQRHPEAAKVHRVFVDAGDGRERHVWCGAFNMQAGDVVPLATPGTVMPDGRSIEPRPILGIQSEGMLCSARELGLGDDHSGIIILPFGTPLGLPYGEALGLAEDVVFDLDLTRNRPDCWGHVGVARDLAAHLGLPFQPPAPPLGTTGPARSTPVDIVDGDRCGRFTSTVLSGVRVGPSARWMAERLTNAGMRPINNVVDVSNYVMLETNQPNHAYDLATLGGGGFRIRLAKDGETMVTLDGATRSLQIDDLLICDANDVPIGIGGIMGGLDSEISDSTTEVALEIAWFEPTGVGQTAARLGLRSEASARFERGVDPYGIDVSIARFAELLRETCPDLVVHAGIADGRGSSLPPAERSVQVRMRQVNRILGTSLTADELPPLLDPIGYTVAATGTDESVTVSVPSWRPDSEAEIDVIEEIARHHGYELLGKTVPKSTMHGRLSTRQIRRRKLRDVLLGLGISEAMPNAFLAPEDLAKAGLTGGTIRIANPLVAEESVLRTSLRPGLLKAIAYNESHRRSAVALYEIGHVYPPGTGPLPDEFEALGVVLAGRDAPAAVMVWREIAAALGLGARLDQSAVPEGMHPGRSATLSAGRNVAVGAVGEVHPDVAEAFGVTERIAVLELDLSVLLEREPPPVKWKYTSRYPSSDIDVAFVLPESVTAEKVEKAIKQGAGNLLVDLALFDVYRGVGVPEGSRSLAYRLRLQAPDRTLTDAEVGQLRQRCIDAAAKLGATLRT